MANFCTVKIMFKCCVFSSYTLHLITVFSTHSKYGWREVVASMLLSSLNAHPHALRTTHTNSGYFCCRFLPSCVVYIAVFLWALHSSFSDSTLLWETYYWHNNSGITDLTHHSASQNEYTLKLSYIQVHVYVNMVYTFIGVFGFTFKCCV